MKYLSLEEFRTLGYLQEVNRQFLHRLGLALEMSVNEKGETYLSGIWDYREDSEGILYTDGVIDMAKSRRVLVELTRRDLYRMVNFGWFVQPTPEEIRILPEDILDLLGDEEDEEVPRRMFDN